MRYFSFLFLLLILFGCGSDDDTSSVPNIVIKGQSSTNLNVFYNTMESIEVEVAYEPGAMPYDGVTNRGFPYWQITEDNLKAIFENRNQSVTYKVPVDRDQMTKIPNKDKESWTRDEILALENQYRFSKNTGKNASFFVLFLNGHFNDNGSIKKNVIGVSLAATTVVVIFKDVIKLEEDNSSPAVAKYMEQATVIHELGHALGLVNNGVPAVSNHEDSNHPAHCTNDQCVMYWKNEGRADLVQFILQVLQDGDNVIFRSHCLEDSKQYKP